jgi:hypothetical protein
MIIKATFVFILIILCGCKYAETFKKASILNSVIDNQLNVRHLGKKESSIPCNVSQEKSSILVMRTLRLLGFEDIQFYKGNFVARRKFYPAIFCGIGGETISVTIETGKISIKSLKTYPYPAATHFFNQEFERVFTKLYINENDS